MTWHSKHKDDACSLCPAGQHHFDDDRDRCARCPFDQYNSGAGEDCITCPANQVANERGDGCQCSKGFYPSSSLKLVCYDKHEDVRNEDFQSRSTLECAKCPEKCTDCGSGTVLLKPGNALSQVNTAAKWQLLTDMTGVVPVFRCPYDDTSCTGQHNSTATLSGCQPGYSAALCSVCTEGYIRAGDECINCETSSVTPGNVLAYVVVTVMVLGVLIALSLQDPSEDLTEASEEQVAEAASSLVTQAKILVGLLQIVTELPETLDLVYPSLFATILSALRILMDPLSAVIELFRLECVRRLGLYARFVLIMALPLAFISVIRVLRCIADARAKRDNASELVANKRKAANSSRQSYHTFFTFFLLYPLLSRTVFHVFSCQQLVEGESGESWHIDDFTVDCNSSTHVFVEIVAAVFMFIYPIGIPLTFFVLLWRDEKQHESQQEQGNVYASTTGAKLARGTDGRTSRPYEKAIQRAGASAVAQTAVTRDSSFEFLRKEYRDEYYYFECVVLVEKLLLTGLLIFVDQGTVFQAFVGVCIAFAFFAVQVRCWPYTNQADNWLKSCAEAQLFMTLLVSIVLRTQLFKDFLTHEDYGVILIVTFFSAPSLASFFFLQYLVRRIRRRTSTTSLQSLEGCASDIVQQDTVDMSDVLADENLGSPSVENRHKTPV